MDEHYAVDATHGGTLAVAKLQEKPAEFSRPINEGIR